ncbi:ArdC family protein [Tenacibaculum sp. 190524A02b]|uniref:ArdC family protein n=1 Tax=Tenacibaculum vairaonense TaxID=3137860 RepID=UPI0031FB30BB
MTTQKFQDLNDKEVSREVLENLVNEAKQENNIEVVYRVSQILIKNPESDSFEISVKQYPNALNAPKHIGDYKDALTECGRLKKGFRFENGKVFKVPGPKFKKGARITFKNKQASITRVQRTPKKSYLYNKENYLYSLKYVNGRKAVNIGESKLSTDVIKQGNQLQLALNGNKLEVSKEFLSGIDFINISDEDLQTGLGKYLAPSEVYSKITQKIIKRIKQAKGERWKKSWNGESILQGSTQRAIEGYLRPANFITKKPYKGLNNVLLLSAADEFQVFENPFFLTEKQVNKLKGEIKKGAKQHELIYYTNLYVFKEKGKIVFKTYSRDKMEDYLIGKKIDVKFFNSYVSYIPILKMYLTYNGSDIDNIDFKLDEFTEIDKRKYGYISVKKVKERHERNPLAEAIIRNQPKPAIKVGFHKESAFYSPVSDSIKLPELNAFDSANAYYATLFHEYIHATGAKHRLNREFGKKFGDKQYAREELIAEIGSIFLCTQAGIIWQTHQNHEAYLNGWLSVLNYIEKDSTLILRASAQAQKAADYILNIQSDGNPKFYKELEKEISKPKTKALAGNIEPVEIVKPVTQQLEKFENPRPITPQIEIEEQEEQTNEIPVNQIEEQKEVKPQITTTSKLPINPSNNRSSLAQKKMARANKKLEYYTICDPEIAKLLGEVEIKEKESVVITLTGGQGSMKTRCAFRFMNTFGQKYKIGHVSKEEHPESSLYWNKVNEYLEGAALNNIDNPDINTAEELDKIIKENDIIVIDSFAKMQEMFKGFEVDKDLRQKYNAKLFIVIFQQTADGKMRGGTKSQYDADIVLYTEKFSDYRNNYVYADKNRYQSKNLEDLKYNIFSGKIITPEKVEEKVSKETSVNEVYF